MHDARIFENLGRDFFKRDTSHKSAGLFLEIFEREGAFYGADMYPRGGGNFFPKKGGGSGKK